MVNTEALIVRIDEMGLKMSYIANRLGISKSSFSLKLHGKRDFWGKEIIALIEMLHIQPEDIGFFFFNEGNKKSTKGV